MNIYLITHVQEFDIHNMHVHMEEFARLRRAYVLFFVFGMLFLHGLCGRSDVKYNDFLRTSH